MDGTSGSLVARLVQRLDGMPLAIELAAARVEALGLTQMLDRLDNRFRLLISANRTATARQRSLEAAVDWSYQLLTEDEQRVFRRLSVFPGSFTLDAAEAVAGTEAGLVVLRLVDCSLLLPPATGPDGRSRYQMLETLRGYGLNRLRETGEEHEAAATLAGHALNVAEQAAAQMTIRSGERTAVLWLDAEDATVHQGLAWALDHDPASALRLAVGLAPWWQVRGRWVQGSGLLQRAAEQAGRDTGTWHRANLWRGHLTRGTFNYAIALHHYSTVVDALSDNPPSADLVDSLLGRCAALRNTGDLRDATADAHTALELARQIGYLTGEGMALGELSLICCYSGDGERAMDFARQAQRIDRSRMPDRFARQIEFILPWALVENRKLDGALDLCVQALSRARAAGDLSDQADTLFMMAVLARLLGRLDDAGPYLREAAEIATQVGYRLRLIDVLDEAGYVTAAADQYAAAVTLWSAWAVQGGDLGLTDTPAEERMREQPLRDARQALGNQQIQAAEERGAAMTLAAASEFAVMMTASKAEQPAAPPVPGKFSSRERELIALVARGQTDAQIAETLVISVSTVRTHLDRIRDKSGCRRRADLTRLALEEGII